MKKFENFRKSILPAFVLLFTLTAAFADKSRFYQDGKVIDTMYVDSAEGLRVRDNPSLKSNRLCGLQHRLPIKVVAIGKEETIDGITAPWVEILIPRYEWKGDEAEYGWVFGGYLSKEVSEKFAVPKTKEQLDFFLRSRLFLWSKFDFSDEGYISVSVEEDFMFFKKYANCDWGGKFTVLSGKEFKYTHTDKDFNRYKPLDYYDVKFIITDISENTFKTKVVGKDFETFCTWEWGESTRGCCEQLFFNSPSLYFISFFSKMDEIFGGYTSSVYCDFNEENNVKLSKNEFIEELIKAGVSAKNSKYEQQYYDYWNPIMAEHQKEADAMK